MRIVTLKCTHCGGDVQLDDTREYGFCMYCGTKILIQQDVNNINVNPSLTKTDWFGDSVQGLTPCASSQNSTVHVKLSIY